EEYQRDIIFYHNTQRADIRWGGSQSGTVPYPCWGTFPFVYSHSVANSLISQNNFQLLKTGDPDGGYYKPAMSDAPLRGYDGRHEWFWEPNDEDHIFPVDHLMKMYLGSVGRNSTLILGLTPNAEGLLPSLDSLRLAEFGEAIASRFSSPLAFLSDVVDRRCLVLELDSPATVHDIVVQEDLDFGERVRLFSVDVLVGGDWIRVFDGSVIGHKVIIPLDDSPEVSAVRLSVDDSLGSPHIRSFSVY
ncbi:MAG: glycoside hydrolase family 29, partial [Rikenellaceae bacterium]